MYYAYRVRICAYIAPYIIILDGIHIGLAHASETTEVTETTEALEHLDHLWDIESRIEQYHGFYACSQFFCKKCGHESSLTAAQKHHIVCIYVVKLFYPLHHSPQVINFSEYRHVLL